MLGLLGHRWLQFMYIYIYIYIHGEKQRCASVHGTVLPPLWYHRLQSTKVTGTDDYNDVNNRSDSFGQFLRGCCSPGADACAACCSALHTNKREGRGGLVHVMGTSASAVQARSAGTRQVFLT
jgi:hypothetical protein